MKVSELIDLLMQYDLDADVDIVYSHYDGNSDIYQAERPSVVASEDGKYLILVPELKCEKATVRATLL
jgi:hypothetical protein